MEESMLEKYPWCTFLRSERMEQSEIALLTLYRMTPVYAAEIPLESEQPLEDVKGASKHTDNSDIEKFLNLDSYRIVADDSQQLDSNVVTEFQIEDEEDDIVTEELAEIYLNQGDKERAKEIYRKLSLRDKENFAYFAEQIEKLGD
ncbi:MAG: hypothetical protein KBS95_02775 [Alistipes sp.]|nr:hypothetical protein [Candidatus Alistipes equi]